MPVASSDRSAVAASLIEKTGYYYRRYDYFPHGTTGPTGTIGPYGYCGWYGHPYPWRY